MKVHIVIDAADPELALILDEKGQTLMLVQVSPLLRARMAGAKQAWFRAKMRPEKGRVLDLEEKLGGEEVPRMT